MKKKPFSFEQDLNFENLSQLLNDIGIITHPLSKEQKVCIEYPNISSESKNMNIINENNENKEAENNKENKFQNEFTLILSKTKNFTIDIDKLYKKFKKNFVYSEEIFKNSVKIFVSIFNNFNEDIFKWNLEEKNLFTSSNKIQFFLIKDIMNNNINVTDELNKLYKEHLESDLNNNNDINNSDKKDDINDDSDDFDENKNIKKIVVEDEFDENLDIINVEDNNEEEIILRNIYFLMNIFNIMNYFSINEFSINNLMRNISLFNSYIINDIKILILIYFNLCIQINLTLSKQSVDNFLGISSPENKITSTTTSNPVSSAINSISKSMSLNFIFGDNDKLDRNDKLGINSYIPSMYFIDYILSNESQNDDEKDKIILFNFIIKIFIWTYFIRNKICLKIFIKILNLDKFNEIKNDFLINQKLENKEKLFELVKETNYINLLSDNLLKEHLILMNADFNLVHNLKLEDIEKFLNMYFPIFINCNMISFEINNQSKFCTLSDYIEELNIIIWVFKFYLQIKKYKFKKHTFTFLSNSFSLAFKKNKDKKIEESYTKEITLFMGINNYKTIELINYLSDINNFNGVYKLYKLIIKSCSNYKKYDIGIRLFKEDIKNMELNYYLSIIVLKLQNYISSHSDLYKKLVLYENKIINPLDCVYLNIKKKLLTIKNKEHFLQLREKGDNKIMSKISKIDFIRILKKNGNDSGADKNEDNLYNFYKKLDVIGLKNEERNALYNCVNETKYYFNEFIVYFISNIITKKNNTNFDPFNLLSHFKNNKCFFIIVENSILDIYIYLTDSFDMNIVTSNGGKEKLMTKKSIFFDSIISNLKLLGFVCKDNFDYKHCHLILNNINIIINKSTLLQKDLFSDYRSLFAEDIIVYVLDEYTKTNCIFGKKEITIIPNFENDEQDFDKNTQEGYENDFSAFYNLFLNSYGIIKFINDKKLRKYNKLNIIYNKKILQIKDGNIQIKYIENEDRDEENKNAEIIVNEVKQEEIKEEKKEINNINNEQKEKEESNDLNKNNANKIEEKKVEKIIRNEYINYKILKIKELFHYENSYPLISFILHKESEISNFSFLFYAFEEIFLSKKEETKIDKQIISKKILKFFNKFKSSDFIPIIFEQKYFYEFLKFFEKIINKKENSSQTHPLFQNLILFFYTEENNYDEIIKKIKEEKGITLNLSKKIYIFKMINGNKYSKNTIGRLFKFNRIIYSLKDFYENNKNKEENGENIIIYNITEELLDTIVKKNNRNCYGNVLKQKFGDISIKDKECLIF